MLLICTQAESCRESWCRVFTLRPGDTQARISDLSWQLARRIIPRLLARHGITEAPGLFAGAIVRLP